MSTATVENHNPSLKLTNNAIEQLKKLIDNKRKDIPNLFLRIFVARGCAGLQYGFSFTDQKTDEDCEIKATNELDNTPLSLPLITDKESASLINGATIDFLKDDTRGPRFIVNNPNDKGGGCAGCPGSCGN